MRRIRQRAGSSLCGQSCVATAAGVSLDRAIEVIGHENGTETRELIAALNFLGIACDVKLRRLSRKRPVLPKRCIVSMLREDTHPPRGHWMLSWDGEISDPDGAWPRVGKWRITSYLEIYA